MTGCLGLENVFCLPKLAGFASSGHPQCGARFWDVRRSFWPRIHSFPAFRQANRMLRQYCGISLFELASVWWLSVRVAVPAANTATANPLKHCNAHLLRRRNFSPSSSSSSSSSTISRLLGTLFVCLTRFAAAPSASPAGRFPALFLWLEAASV